ncbi:TetR/AcrR family transcriptional regulator [Mobilitalea sibirica]|uniref:TetR/AcrR family transcriptional regulator n=1 Tax=Mobilitalea sibirica TaxID=1462919 RepID=A0A8J7KWA1_9FIRM|nr:TetR/AcrR family transcriptional regulator [Mobilitalea sibirica]MBH1941110.1 TetR/AcrR family transcriptional regulator [Mobilitalea sibirica]
MERPLIERKESIILTTIDVINELGIQGLSTREVCKRQGIANASLFNHFKSKNDLIIAVLDYYAQYDYAIFQSIKVKKLTAIDAVRYFFDSYFTYYENYPAITAILHAYDILRFEPSLTEKVDSILKEREKYLIELINEAQTAKLLRSDINSECISDILVGTGRAITLKWRMSNYEFSLKERILYAIDAILDSFIPKNI